MYFIVCVLKKEPNKQTNKKQRNVFETLMPPSLGNIHEENEWKLKVIEFVLSPRGIILLKIARSYPESNLT